MSGERSSRLVKFGERLPHRLIYAGAIISIELVGLQTNRALFKYHPPAWILLMVAFGLVRVHTDDAVFVLNEGDAFQLNPSCEYDMTTDQVTDLLLITMSNKNQSCEAVRAIPESPRCHSIHFPETLADR